MRQSAKVEMSRRVAKEYYGREILVQFFSMESRSPDRGNPSSTLTSGFSGRKQDGSTLKCQGEVADQQELVCLSRCTYALTYHIIVVRTAVRTGMVGMVDSQRVADRSHDSPKW